MQYSEALNFIHGIARFGSKPGLKHVSELLERMGNPQDKLKFIHIAGTNGKGSTSTMLSHILTRAGYKTGLYISPYVLQFRERIQVNNKMISEDDLAASTTLVKRHWDIMDAVGETPTEFEVVVAAAMDYFARMNCDVVVLEVGMGGRLDATNVINTPLCSVITSISLDHTEYLGDTISAIAYEKCGIIKPNGVTVSYPEQPAEAAEVIESTCKRQNNRLFIGGKAKVLSCDITGSRICYDGMKIDIPLIGTHQILNAVTVVEAVKAVRLSGIEISAEDIVTGIGETVFPSRLEVLSKEPFLVLLDGAHNLSGAEALAGALRLLSGRKIHALAGFMADKDVDGMLRLILPYCVSVTAFAPDNPRSMSAGELAERCAKYYCGSVYTAETAYGAASAVLGRCGDNDAALIFGSLYLAAELRPVIQDLLGKT